MTTLGVTTYVSTAPDTYGAFKLESAAGRREIGLVIIGSSQRVRVPSDEV